jgi:hypothetical protein
MGKQQEKGFHLRHRRLAVDMKRIDALNSRWVYSDIYTCRACNFSAESPPLQPADAGAT